MKTDLAGMYKVTIQETLRSQQPHSHIPRLAARVVSRLKLELGYKGNKSLTA